jgi:hypothetical protein
VLPQRGVDSLVGVGTERCLAAGVASLHGHATDLDMMRLAVVLDSTLAIDRRRANGLGSATDADAGERSSRWLGGRHGFNGEDAGTDDDESGMRVVFRFDSELDESPLAVDGNLHAEPDVKVLAGSVAADP